MKASVVLILSLSFMLLISTAARSADWYVRAGSDGEGTKDKPFPDMWKALAKATRGDVIHVAEGVYGGKGGSGHWVISIPNLTLVGGYRSDFSERNPFQFMTVLERARDFKGDWTGLPESGAFIAGDLHKDHSGLLVDGFVMNGQSRNRYKADGDIDFKGSYPGVGISASSANLKFRNCVVLNPLGDGIYCTWQGEDNEIANCFVVNTFYNAIATRSSQPKSKVVLRNNTIAFCWFYPSKGGGMSVFVGRQGKTVMDANVFMCNQTEGDEAGFGVSNTFGNDETELTNNLFFQCQGGYYKYMDANKQSLVAWKPQDLKDLNQDAENYVLAKSGGNTDEDSKMEPDKDFFEKFSNFVASKPGKLNMDMMNEWRRSVGLPLQAEPGSPRKNYGMAYPLDKVVPNLVSKVAGKGAQIAGPFQDYKAATGAAPVAGIEAGQPTAAKTYEETTFENLAKGAAGVKDLKAKAVSLRGGMGAKATSFLLKEATSADYDCFKFAKPGQNPDATRDVLYVYILKGSEAWKAWDKLYKKKDKYLEKGIVLKGSVSYVGSDNYPYPVGLIVEAVSAE